MKPGLLISAALFLLFGSSAVAGPLDLPIVQVTADASGAETYTLSLQLLLIMTALTLLPAGLMMLTSFTRIVVVLALLRQALGTAQTPSNQVLIGISLFMTLFIMGPVLDSVYEQAAAPYLEERIGATEAMQQAQGPLQAFLLSHTRETDLQLFMDLSDTQDLPGPEAVPFRVLVPAFVTSELKTAFQIGFVIFIPFLIIDLIVASVLMSLGMMMLSPVIISFPFKLMLFVLADGWNLVLGTLAASYG